METRDQEEIRQVFERVTRKWQEPEPSPPA
jgi:hypothetical protein